MASSAGSTRTLGLRRTPQGWGILRIPHEAIPDYDFEAACEGLTEDQIRQELLIDWTASSNQRIFPGFGEVHIAADPDHPQVRLDPRKPIINGWDFGNIPAWVPMQLNDLGQLVLHPPLVGPPEVATDIYEFGWEVRDHLEREYCTKRRVPYSRLQLYHFGDPAGKAKPPKTRKVTDEKLELRSAYQILYQGTQVVTGYTARGEPIIEEQPGLKWRIQPGAIAIRTRLAAVRGRLRLLLGNGIPALICHPGATTLIEGFKGAYHYKQRTDGTYETEPNKNWHSHPMDAMQYPMTRLFGTAPQDEDEDQDGPEEFRSHAAGRRG